MIDPIVIVDLVGVGAFFLAFYYAHFSYKQSRRTAEYWLMYSIGMMLGFFWAITMALESLGIGPHIMQDFQPPLLATCAVTLAVIARLSFDGLIKPADA